MRHYYHVFLFFIIFFKPTFFIGMELPAVPSSETAWGNNPYEAYRIAVGHDDVVTMEHLDKIPSLRLNPDDYLAGAVGDRAYGSVAYLLHKGADANTRRDQGILPLHYAVAQATRPLLVKWLRIFGADPSLVGKFAGFNKELNSRELARAMLGEAPSRKEAMLEIIDLLQQPAENFLNRKHEVAIKPKTTFDAIQQRNIQALADFHQENPKQFCLEINLPGVAISRSNIPALHFLISKGFDPKEALVSAARVLSNITMVKELLMHYNLDPKRVIINGKTCIEHVAAEPYELFPGVTLSGISREEWEARKKALLSILRNPRAIALDHVRKGQLLIKMLNVRERTGFFT